MNKYKIRVLPNIDLYKVLPDGIICPDAKLWKDEYIYKTNLSFEEVSAFSFIIAIKRLE